MTDSAFPTAALQKVLRDGRNADGGWGYYAGKSSRLEPTCWALLALRDLDPAPLRQWPTTEGRLLERPGGSVNYGFHALALLAMAARGVEHREGTQRLIGGLQSGKGVKLEPATVNRQNNQLQGWSWIDGTFSWGEPTAWALLALRKLAAAGFAVDAARMSEAEAVLVDRCCEQGGWNYGNANMFGKELYPYVPTTAIALMALQKAQATAARAAVAKSLSFLERGGMGESSSVALSLAAIALALFDRAADNVVTELARSSERTVLLRSQLGIAMSLVSTQVPAAADAFRF